MERKIKFQKNKQKEFLNKVIQNLNSPSLRNLLNFIPNTTYSSLKNYYTERRLIPEQLFIDLLHLAKIPKQSLTIIYLDKNWGKIKGGKKSKRNGPTKNRT